MRPRSGAAVGTVVLLRARVCLTWSGVVDGDQGPQ